MKVKKQNRITATILLFSLILIFTGIYIYFTEEKNYEKENNQQIIYKPAPDSIKIETSDVVSPDVEKETTPSENNDQNSIPNNNNNLEKNVEQKRSPTIEQLNDKQRSLLEMEYDIAIRYGEETSGYSIGGIDTTVISDPQIIQASLNELKKALGVYPPGFFREFSKKGMYLTVYLIDQYSVENVTGITDPRTNNVTISIATAYPFGESFHHEVFHYIERYIKINGGTFSSWEVFNPSDFAYGQENLSYCYINTLSIDSYFVNSYAETDASEDRASTFEFMMADNKASFFEKDRPLMNKSKYIADVIDLFFTTVDATTMEYWERYL